MPRPRNTPRNGSRNPRQTRNTRNTRNRSSARNTVDFWGTADQLPTAEEVAPTADPYAVARSLGRPPFSGTEAIAEHHLRSVYSNAVRLSEALAAAGGLIADDDTHDDDAHIDAHDDAHVVADDVNT